MLCAAIWQGSFGLQLKGGKAMPFSFRSLFGNGGRHGSHRRANPTSHDHSADGTGTRSRAHNAAARADTAESGAPAVPSAGIRAGEIIGHRLWWVVQQDGVPWLRSLAHHFLWIPGEPVKGNIREIVASHLVTHHNYIERKNIWGGVYSYPTSGHLSKEIAFWRGFACGPLVLGTVKLWGEVVEHKEGYRAEYAKVHSLRAVVSRPGDPPGAVDLEALRTRYL